MTTYLTFKTDFKDFRMKVLIIIETYFVIKNPLSNNFV